MPGETWKSPVMAGLPPYEEHTQTCGMWWVETPVASSPAAWHLRSVCGVVGCDELSQTSVLKVSEERAHSRTLRGWPIHDQQLQWQQKALIYDVSGRHLWFYKLLKKDKHKKLKCWLSPSILLKDRCRREMGYLKSRNNVWFETPNQMLLRHSSAY